MTWKLGSAKLTPTPHDEDDRGVVALDDVNDLVDDVKTRQRKPLAATL